MVVLDLHGLTVDEALKLIQRTVMDPKNKNEQYIEVIHGFNNGDELKQLCSHPRYLRCKKIKKTTRGLHNPGVTLLWLG